MSPNLTASLLAERIKKLTPVEVPDADLTIHVRQLSFKEGRDFSHKLDSLDATDSEQREEFLASVAELVIIDPETGNPVFSDTFPLGSLPLVTYKAVVLSAVMAIGVFIPTTTTTTATTATTVDNVAVVTEGATPLAGTAPTATSVPETEPTFITPTTPLAPLTDTPAVQEIATDSSIDSQSVSEYGT